MLKAAGLIVDFYRELASELAQAHDVAHRVQEQVRAQVPDVREVMVEPAPLSTDLRRPLHAKPSINP